MGLLKVAGWTCHDMLARYAAATATNRAAIAEVRGLRPGDV
jgi:hypothetical protein